MFNLSNYASENVSDEEKQKYDGRMRETGTYRGYKLRQFWVTNYLLLMWKIDRILTLTLTAYCRGCPRRD